MTPDRVDAIERKVEQLLRESLCPYPTAHGFGFTFMLRGAAGSRAIVYRYPLAAIP